jgi:methylenetetrahydrofolate dehydrogenase (NADP+)/methenyltetrahydrofolate cyclohydrolase
MAIIIDGKKIAEDIRREVGEKVLRLKSEKGLVPGLAVVLMGEDPASRIYVGWKEKACHEAGFLSREYKLPAETEEENILGLAPSKTNSS